MQRLPSQSLATEQAAPVAPSLQLPTKESSGRTQREPLAQSADSLHEAPGSPP